MWPFFGKVKHENAPKRCEKHKKMTSTEARLEQSVPIVSALSALERSNSYQLGEEGGSTLNFCLYIDLALESALADHLNK